MAAAQAVATTIKMEGPIGGLQIGEEQKRMLEASQKVLKQDYAGALAIYDQIIAANGANTQAYLQRGIVRREMKDTAGSRADGAAALRLADMASQQSPQNAKVYYQRGSAHRLLGNFPEARADIEKAISLSPRPRSDWQADLRAIDLEAKMNP